MSQPNSVIHMETQSADQSFSTVSAEPASAIPEVDVRDHLTDDPANAHRAAKVQDTNGCRCPPPEKRSRNLVVCIDGTSNQFGENNTNVIELYRLVKKLPGDKQLTYYNSGIGTYAQPSWRSLQYLKQVLDHKIDLAIAWNFERIVLHAYRWLSENYREGDQIYLFGFSRGAYQVRTLSAMICKVGLIHKGNEEQIPFAYELYAAEQFEKDKKHQKSNASGSGDAGTDETKSERFKKTFSREVQVHFVGAWDTVSSVGVVRHKVLPGTANGMKHVCFFRHALALDERRVKFLPEYVNQGLSQLETQTQTGEVSNQVGSSSHPQPSGTSQSRSSHTKEVWFVGIHSDIGGGNVNNESMDRRAAPLRWMVYQAVIAGLRLHALSEGITMKEPLMEVHESLTGIWWLLEVLPIKHLTYKTKSGTKRRPHLGAVRRVKDGQTIHSTVLATVRDSKNASKHYVPKAKSSWSWTELQRWNIHLEEDLFEIVQGALEKCSEKFKKLSDNDPFADDDLLGDLEEWLWIDEGRRALRERNAPKYLLSEAMKAADKLTYCHMDVLMTTLMRVGPGSEKPVLGSDFASKLRICSKWKDFREMFFPGRELLKLYGHSADVNSIAFSPDSKYIISGSDDKTVRVWDAETGRVLGDPFSGHKSAVLSVAVSPDGQHIISGSSDATIRVWDAATGTTILAPINGHTGTVTSVAFSPNGKHIASGSRDGTIRLWDARTGSAIGKPLTRHTGYVLSVAFSPDGAHVVSGSLDRSVRIWDAETGMAIGEPFTGHEGWVESVAFSPDGQLVISSSDDATIRIWDVATGTAILAPLQGHTSFVRSVAFSPDGKQIVSGSDDQTIRIWDAATGSIIGKPLTGHSSMVWSVAFSPDGTRVVSGSVDRTVRVWDVEDLIV
ncbi:WD40 repeat-like protein [Obba rivulosa]|uniref:WD40 repeat-like protein n=1 Tax=Obba rivulosa TaxID=1052685 RepID=A0A8E2AVP5_9APHY|nr:WD40 repeat-like protein [Obba rivulosa]